MFSDKMIEAYTDWQAWLHDYLIADRAVNLHFYIFEHTKLANSLAEQKERNVLDVGCGGGQTLLRLKTLHPQLQLTGIDLSASQINRAQQRAKKQRCSIQFEVADAEALPFPDACFDVVYSFGSVKHWPNPLQGISECWRVLKAGGELLLTDGTSDATRKQVLSFYEIAGFPNWLKSPAVALVSRLIVRPARPLAVYEEIATQLGMPAQTVTSPSYMPAFLFHTWKPS
ncbi:MAG: class I SAM-dependent methyltransferase [Anaerolineaceae bacterium]|nr:class I SAM-dependent methyltransferase [Anaerolineaceae bacterium]